QQLEALADLCQGVASNLLEKGLSLVPSSEREKEEQGMYVADALDLVGAMLLDERRERAVQLNVPLTLLLLRDEQTRLLPRLLEAAGLLLDLVGREGGRPGGRAGGDGLPQEWP
ncbi:hypothetical protein VYU27_009637, partial [Nannochloropsis oceanica]